MAWQTPKTNWSSADGVRDTDFNRIEGNLQELYDTAKMHADKTIYVDISGNDTTGNGTYAAPFATVSKALSTLPKDLNDKNIVIDISSGGYADNPVISGFNGVLNLHTSGVATFRSMTIIGCNVNHTGSQLNCTNGIVLKNGATFVGSSIMYIGGSNTVGLSVQSGSTFVLFNTLTVSNSTAFAVEVYGQGRMYVATLAGSNNKTGLTASNGGVATYGSMTMSATTARVANTGGRIYADAQTSIPNY